MAEPRALGALRAEFGKEWKGDTSSMDWDYRSQGALRGRKRRDLSIRPNLGASGCTLRAEARSCRLAIADLLPVPVRESALAPTSSRGW